MTNLEKTCIERGIVIPRWLPGSDSVFWYRRIICPETEFAFVFVDCEAGICQLAFDHDDLAAKLSDKTMTEINPSNLPFTWISLDATCTYVRFQFHDITWHYSMNGNLEKWDGSFDDDRSDRGCQHTASPWSSESVDVTFHNQTSTGINMHWIDNNGNITKPQLIHANKSKKFSSWLGHKWRVAVPDTNPDKYIICELTERRCIASIYDSPSGMSLQWEMDPPLQNEQHVLQLRNDQSEHAVFIRAHNLWLRYPDKGVQMTFDGNSGNTFKTIYQSPNGLHVVGFQAKPSSSSKLYLLDVAPKSQFPPRLRTEDYLRAGDDVEVLQPRLFDIGTRKEITLNDTSLFDRPYSITNIGWAAKSDKYWFLYNQRGHQHLRIIEISVEGGTRSVVDEYSSTFIDYNQKLYYKLLPATDELIWASERDNFNHLYLMSISSGETKYQITQGEWNVFQVHRVDCNKRQIWFAGMGMVPGQDPYYSHLACVDFDGSNFRIITQGNGTHQWKWGPNHRFVIDSWSRIDDPGEMVVRETMTGLQMVSLQRGFQDSKPQDLSQWSPPERFAAPGRDGRTLIYGMILRPKDFNTILKYPILEFVYAGPQSFTTPKAFADISQFRRLADEGFIVVMSDGMGTNWRNKPFHDVCHKNHRDGGFLDRIAWIRAAASTRPWMDLTRVGCYGSSHGGYDAACAAIHYSDFYVAAMAAAGNHDHRMGHLQWNEMWMGYPVNDSYVDNSNVTHAPKLGAHLMLVAGGLDDNVDSAATLRLADALIKADKDFDLVYVPTGDHYVHKMPWVIKKQLAFFKRHLGSSQDQ